MTSVGVVPGDSNIPRFLIPEPTPTPTPTPGEEPSPGPRNFL
ncbi:hypothetical protein ACL6C3_22445 [Capilliphycus salinus ALCB114379]